MVKSARPALAAAVAALTLKLWPLNLETSSPVDDSTCRTAVTSLCQDSGSPDWSRSGPSVERRHVRYGKRAATGHNVSPVLPRWIVTPVPMTSILLHRKVMCNIVGLVWLSIAMSTNDNMWRS